MRDLEDNLNRLSWNLTFFCLCWLLSIIASAMMLLSWMLLPIRLWQYIPIFNLITGVVIVLLSVLSRIQFIQLLKNVHRYGAFEISILFEFVLFLLYIFPFSYIACFRIPYERTWVIVIQSWSNALVLFSIQRWISRLSGTSPTGLLRIALGLVLSASIMHLMSCYEGGDLLLILGLFFSVLGLILGTIGFRKTYYFIQKYIDQTTNR